MSEKISVEICVGTTCFILGASALQDLEGFLPPDLADKVEISGCTCLGMCRNNHFGEAPFVRIGGEKIVSRATVDSVIDAIREDVS